MRGNLSQEEFGRKFGVGKSTVSRWEAGLLIPNEETLKKIADYGGVTVDYLLHGQEEEPVAALGEAEAPFARPRPGEPGLHDPALFAAVDKVVLTDIIQSVLEALKQRKRPLHARHLAFVIALLYDEFQKTGAAPDKETVNFYIAGMY